MNGKKFSEDIVKEAVIKLWKDSHYSYDVVAFFYQKHEWESDDRWERCAEIVFCDSADSLDVSFLNAFCEGETCVKDLKIVPLSDVLEYYHKRCIIDQSTSDAT